MNDPILKIEDPYIKIKIKSIFYAIGIGFGIIFIALISNILSLPKEFNNGVFPRIEEIKIQYASEMKRANDNISVINNENKILENRIKILEKKLTVTNETN